MKNITTVTKRNISDSITISKIWYHGRMQELDFLNRLFDLESMISHDPRYKSAYRDIYQHTVNNSDWESDWIFTDKRFNLENCEDEYYLNFLCATIHPVVCFDENEIVTLLNIYNSNLINDGYQIISSDLISGKPVYKWMQTDLNLAQSVETITEIKQFLNHDYIHHKIELMRKSLIDNRDVAIGTAKELIESVCISILDKKGIEIDSSWTLSKLFKETTSNLNFTHEELTESEEFEKSLRQLLSGISNIIHSISEIRNSFGSGHGKIPEFKQIDYKYAKFIVGIVSEIAVFYLAINEEEIELVNKKDVEDDIPF